MTHYLATGLNVDGHLVQLCVSLDESDPAYREPIKCCAANQEFWRDKLSAYRVDRTTAIKKIHGVVVL